MLLRWGGRALSWCMRGCFVSMLAAGVTANGSTSVQAMPIRVRGGGACLPVLPLSLNQPKHECRNNGLLGATAHAKSTCGCSMAIDAAIEAGVGIVDGPPRYYEGSEAGFSARSKPFTSSKKGSLSPPRARIPSLHAPRAASAPPPRTVLGGRGTRPDCSRFHVYPDPVLRAPASRLPAPRAASAPPPRASLDRGTALPEGWKLAAVGFLPQVHRPALHTGSFYIHTHSHAHTLCAICFHMCMCILIFIYIHTYLRGKILRQTRCYTQFGFCHVFQENVALENVYTLNPKP